MPSPRRLAAALPVQVRASVLTASQCATYDEVKSRLLALTGLRDGLGAQLACSLVTGLVTTTVTNPVDVVKVTRGGLLCPACCALPAVPCLLCPACCALPGEICMQCTDVYLMYDSRV